MYRHMMISAVTLSALACADRATAPGAEQARNTEHTTAPRLLTASILAGDAQLAVVGTALSLGVRVLLDGLPARGIEVHWETGSGELPAVTRSDASGIARATWTLGHTPGKQRATAYLNAANRPRVLTLPFTATARPGPAVQLVAASATEVRAAVNSAFAFDANTPRVRPVDMYGNVVPDPVVMWSILDGPLATWVDPQALSAADPRTGLVWFFVRSTGDQGVGHVRASLAGTAVGLDFTLTVGPPEYVARIIIESDFYDRDGCPIYAYPTFVSQQNRSGENGEAAVDTIPIGASFHWLNLLCPAELPQQVLALDDAFPPSPLLHSGDRYSVTFDKAGTYRYADAADPGAPPGTIVVR